MNVICQYCNAPAALVDSSVVYGKSFGLIYLCSNYPICDSYVGVHRNTDLPKGSLANRELRLLRKRAHGYFDEIWKSGRKSRGAAYRCMIDSMGITPAEAHIGEFNEARCKQLIEILTIGDIDERL